MSVKDARNQKSRLLEGRLGTGIEILDEDTLRGIPAGSTIAILGDPLGQGRFIPYYLPLSKRPTQYISTVKPKKYIEQDIYRLKHYPNKRLKNLTVEDTISGTDSTTEAIHKYTARIGKNHNFVVDTISALGESEEFTKVVREIQRKTRETNSLSYLYFSTTSLDTLTRAEKEAIHALEGVFKVDTEAVGGTLETRLSILRLTGSEIPKKEIKLNVTGNDLIVDTTREIA